MNPKQKLARGLETQKITDDTSMVRIKSSKTTIGAITRFENINGKIRYEFFAPGLTDGYNVRARRYEALAALYLHYTATTGSSSAEYNRYRDEVNELLTEIHNAEWIPNDDEPTADTKEDHITLVEYNGKSPTTRAHGLRSVTTTTRRDGAFEPNAYKLDTDNTPDPEPEPKEDTVNLTDNERKVLDALKNDDHMGDSAPDYDGAAWVDCLTDTLTSEYGIAAASLGGIFASLSTKGLIWTNAESCGFTEAGIALISTPEPDPEPEAPADDDRADLDSADPQTSIGKLKDYVSRSAASYERQLADFRAAVADPEQELMYVLEWSISSFKWAAKLEAAHRVLNAINRWAEGDARTGDEMVEVIIEMIRNDAFRKVQFPSFSTSPTSNLAETCRGSALAELAEEMRWVR
jgi:hypothetical protein